MNATSFAQSRFAGRAEHESLGACRRNRLLDRELKNQPPQLAQDRRSRLGPPLEVDQKTPKTCAKGFLRQAPSPFYGLSRQRVPNARQGIRKACVAEEIADARRCAYWAGKTLARSVPWGESGGSLSIGRSSAIMALQGQAPPRWARPGTGGAAAPRWGYPTGKVRSRPARITGRRRAGTKE